MPYSLAARPCSPLQTRWSSRWAGRQQEWRQQVSRANRTALPSGLGWALWLRASPLKGQDSGHQRELAILPPPCHPVFWGTGHLILCPDNGEHICRASLAFVPGPSSHRWATPTAHTSSDLRDKYLWGSGQGKGAVVVNTAYTCHSSGGHTSVCGVPCGEGCIWGVKRKGTG